MKTLNVNCKTGRETVTEADPALTAVEMEKRVSVEDRLAAVEARLDRAASAAVTGEAAKLRDNLKPVL